MGHSLLGTRDVLAFWCKTTRDADDVVVLSEAVAGLADVVVTGDGDILDIAEMLPVPAVSPRGFWEMLHGRS